MRATSFPVMALTIGALVASGSCFAGTPEATPAQNCAQALANSLHARLRGVDTQPSYRPAPLRSWPEVHKLIVRAYTSNGLRSIPMICTYDESGRVIALTRPSDVYGRLLVNGTTPRDWPNTIIPSR